MPSPRLAHRPGQPEGSICARASERMGSKARATPSLKANFRATNQNLRPCDGRGFFTITSPRTAPQFSCSGEHCIEWVRLTIGTIIPRLRPRPPPALKLFCALRSVCASWTGTDHPDSIVEGLTSRRTKYTRLPPARAEQVRAACPKSDPEAQGDRPRAGPHGQGDKGRRPEVMPTPQA